MLQGLPSFRRPPILFDNVTNHDLSQQYRVTGVKRMRFIGQPPAIINSREHNNANVLTMGTAQHKPEEICVMAALWLKTRFEGGRHWPRINKMMSLERD